MRYDNFRYLNNTRSINITSDYDDGYHKGYNDRQLEYERKILDLKNQIWSLRDTINIMKKQKEYYANGTLQK